VEDVRAGLLLGEGVRLAVGDLRNSAMESSMAAWTDSFSRNPSMPPKTSSICSTISPSSMSANSALSARVVSTCFERVPSR